MEKTGGLRLAGAISDAMGQERRFAYRFLPRAEIRVASEGEKYYLSSQSIEECLLTQESMLVNTGDIVLFTAILVEPGKHCLAGDAQPSGRLFLVSPPPHAWRIHRFSASTNGKAQPIKIKWFRQAVISLPVRQPQLPP